MVNEMHEVSVTSYLQGGANVDPRAMWTNHYGESLGSSSRILQGNNATNANSSTFTYTLAFPVVFISLFVGICVYQALRIWLCLCLCDRDLRITERTLEAVNADNTVLMHDGKVFTLTGDQRRAVLEVIFSDTSKVR
jgi:hypothetical protein